MPAGRYAMLVVMMTPAKHTFMTIVAVAVLATAGCADFMKERRERSLARELEIARNDHARCAEKGHEFPSDSYINCRKSLVDQREREIWEDYQVMESTSGGAESAPMNRERFRPTTERGDFTCFRTSAGDVSYIKCETRDRSE